MEHLLSAAVRTQTYFIQHTRERALLASFYRWGDSTRVSGDWIHQPGTGRQALLTQALLPSTLCSLQIQQHLNAPGPRSENFLLFGTKRRPWKLEKPSLWFKMMERATWEGLQVIQSHHRWAPCYFWIVSNLSSLNLSHTWELWYWLMFPYY